MCHKWHFAVQIIALIPFRFEDECKSVTISVLLLRLSHCCLSEVVE